MYDNVEYWNKVFTNLNDPYPKYDLWLDKFREILHFSKEHTIIDLGCGTGADALYLYERGFNVVACDYSEVALSIVKKNIPHVDTIKLDITENMPFLDNCIKVIISDLSLHYFDTNTTKSILLEISRVLEANGKLICRVNSNSDINYGDLGYEEVEKNFCLTNEGYKRFFNKEDIRHFFVHWEIVYCEEAYMNRYGMLKKTWEIVVSKK